MLALRATAAVSQTVVTAAAAVKAMTAMLS
jgi:hypothetical protein